MRLTIGMLVCIAALSLTAIGQTTKVIDGKPAQKTEAAPAAPNAAQQAPKPSPEIRKLARSFVGRWRVTGKILDEQWAPGGAEGNGFETVRRGPGGFSLISDSRMDFGKMGLMNGHGVIFFDAARQGYTGYWCDTWSPICDTIGLGKWEGDKLVFHGEMQMGSGKVQIRQTYSNFSKNGYDWFMEASDGKDSWKPQMQLRYERFTRAVSPAEANSGSTQKSTPDATSPKQ